jgi:TonB family protein
MTRVLAFALTFVIGVGAAAGLAGNLISSVPMDSVYGSGPKDNQHDFSLSAFQSMEPGKSQISCSEPSVRDFRPTITLEKRKVENFRVTSRPRAEYTELGRQQKIEGTTRLRLELRGDGKVGNVVVVTRLPFGLTEQAMKAACKIEFIPRKVNGFPATTQVTVDYNFRLD